MPNHTETTKATETKKATGATETTEVAEATEATEATEAAEASIFTAAVITVSDKGFAGLREDAGGPLTAEILENHGYRVIHREIVPDERPMIERALIRCADELKVDLAVTTGGTGFSPRDVTPEATIAVCERMAPGIAEAMRMESYRITKRAMLSRAASGIRGRTLIINLPGSPKAVRENLEAVLDPLAHGIEILRGSAGECGARA